MVDMMKQMVKLWFRLTSEVLREISTHIDRPTAGNCPARAFLASWVTSGISLIAKLNCKIMRINFTFQKLVWETYSVVPYGTTDLYLLEHRLPPMIIYRTDTNLGCHTVQVTNSHLAFLPTVLLHNRGITSVECFLPYYSLSLPLFVPESQTPHRKGMKRNPHKKLKLRG